MWLGINFELDAPYHVKKLNLWEVRPTTISLQMVDLSIKYPLGVSEDVHMYVGDSHVLVDFVILGPEVKSQSLLGGVSWPPLGVVLIWKNCKLSFDLLDDLVEFNLFKAFKFRYISTKCDRVDEIDNLVREEVINQVYGDSLGHLWVERWCYRG